MSIVIIFIVIDIVIITCSEVLVLMYDLVVCTYSAVLVLHSLVPFVDLALLSGSYVVLSLMTAAFPRTTSTKSSGSMSQ